MAEKKNTSKTQPKTKTTKKKNTKLPINALDNIMKTIVNEADVFVKDGHEEINFKVKTYLTPEESLRFVRDVTNICVVDNAYYPALFDIAFKLAFFEICTNITLPSNINKSTNFIYGSGVYEALSGEVESLVFRLREVCREQINLITRKPKSDELFDLIISIVEKYESKLDDINFKELAEKLSGMDKIDEQKLADAVLGRKTGEVIEFPSADELEGQIAFDETETEDE